MNCPACQHKLTRLKAGKVWLDACHGGCGGIWFDANELEKTNQFKSRAQDWLQVRRDPAVIVDPARDRKCPRCKTVMLERRLFSLGTGVEMDCCPKCDGVWLDAGELETIQEETNPQSRPARHVVTRKAKAVPVAVSFNLPQQVQTIRIQARPQSLPRRPSRVG